MLVLSRFQNEKITIGDDIEICVVSVASNGKVRIGIEAPANVKVHRREVYDAIQRERQCNEEETDQEADERS